MSVAPAGPPFVSTNTESKTCMLTSVVSTTATSSVGAIPGSVTNRKRLHGDAPSIAAAS